MGDPPRMPAGKRKHKQNSLSLPPLMPEEALKKALGVPTRDDEKKPQAKKR